MDRFQVLDDFLASRVEKGPAGNGCIIAQNGEILYEGYHGYADLEKKTPITEETVYRQYSATKVAVCTTAMILVERGKMLLTDPIYEYFPEWKNTMVADKNEDGSVTIRPAKRPIEVRDCFSMSMGIGYGGPDYTHQMMAKVRADLAAKDPYYTLRDDIRAMAGVPTCFDPGAHWLYGFGHELVAGLIEVCSGQTVWQFMKENLLDPLGMDHTGYRYFGDMREKMVTPYNLNADGTRTPALPAMFDDRFEPEAKYEAGGAGLFSSVRDYTKMAQMLANGGTYKGVRVMGRHTIDLMRQNQLSETQMKDFTNPYLEGYGYGLGVRTYVDRSRSSGANIGEFGWTGYMGTFCEVDPAEGLSIIYMHNSVPNQEEYTHPRIRNIVYGAID